MKEIKLFWKILKNNRLTYFLSMISTISGLTPIVIMITVDSIIGDKEYKYDILEKAVNLIGGRDFLRSHIYILAFVIVILTGISCIFIFLRNYYSNVACENLIYNLKEKMYNKFLNIDIRCLNDYSTGDLIQRSSSDIETVRKLFSTQLVNAFGSIATIILVIIVMSLINLKLAMISISLCIVISFLSYVFYGKIGKIFKETDEAESQLMVFIKEALFNIRVIKAFNREDYILKLFREKNEEFNITQNKFMKTFAKFRAVNDFLTFLQLAIIIVVGGYETISGRMNFGDLIAFVIYINMIIWPIRQMGQLLSDMAKASVSISRIYEVLDLPEEDYEYGIRDVSFSEKIEFKNVSLVINDNKILDNISFVINAGESLGVIGSTGSGKSMIVYLLLGLFEATSGEILIDGINIKEINKRYLREKISAIMQESELFNMSILENVKITNDKIDDKSIFNATKVSSIHDEILNFSSKYETIVIDNGGNLSGGQKQRISIARGLLKPFEVLILDDSLSAVDMNTDLKINNALKSMDKKFTSIFISHRISTITNCDNIIVMDEGKIVESGKHNDLIMKNGIYSKINEIQSKEYDVSNE